MSSRPPCAVERLARVCQLLAGQALDWCEPPSAAALEDLFAPVGSPSMEIARLSMERTLSVFAKKMAGVIHANFHGRFRCPGACRFSPPDLNPRRDATGDLLTHGTLVAWAEQFRQEFLATHNSPAQRARRMLEQPGGTALAIGALSKAIGAGRRTLERQFRLEIGSSLAEYRTRLRVGGAVRQLQNDDGCVESAALNAGWASGKGLYEALDKLTGLKPATVRHPSPLDRHTLAAALGPGALCPPD